MTETEVLTLLFLVVPVSVLAIEIVLGVYLWRRNRTLHGAPGSTLLGAMVSFVVITAGAQSLNAVLAVYVITAGKGASPYVTLGLFFGAQIIRAVAIGAAAWRLLRRIHRTPDQAHPYVGEGDH